MATYCDACGGRLHGPENEKVCLQAHEWTDEHESVTVHVGCPCPEHDWTDEFAYPRE